MAARERERDPPHPCQKKCQKKCRQFWHKRLGEVTATNNSPRSPAECVDPDVWRKRRRQKKGRDEGIKKKKTHVLIVLLRRWCRFPLFSPPPPPSRIHLPPPSPLHRHGMLVKPVSRALREAVNLPANKTVAFDLAGTCTCPPSISRDLDLDLFLFLFFFLSPAFSVSLSFPRFLCVALCLYHGRPGNRALLSISHLSLSISRSISLTVSSFSACLNLSIADHLACACMHVHVDAAASFSFYFPFSFLLLCLFQSLFLYLFPFLFLNRIVSTLCPVRATFPSASLFFLFFSWGVVFLVTVQTHLEPHRRWQAPYPIALLCIVAQTKLWLTDYVDNYPSALPASRPQARPAPASGTPSAP